MEIERLSLHVDREKVLKELGVDGGGVKILASKINHYTISIKGLHVGGANILKQDALSVGADLAVPRGTIIATTPHVDCILIATQRQLEVLSRKELAQPFGLKEVASKLKDILQTSKPLHVEIMGVINANDDSFFSGSRFKNIDAIDKITQMIEEGADIIDIGGVSSRPNALHVEPEDELQRVKPILNAIKENKLFEKAKFSIDSYEPSVISYALESGFHIVNDITGLRDERVIKLCAQYGATAVIMHMQGRPQTMQNSPKYENILSDVYSFLQESKNRAISMGVKDIVLDVGIGFGKSLNHNLSLIKNLEHFLTLNSPLLIGASRKSMINEISTSDVSQRLSGTIAIHLESIRNGASIVRVHDVKEHKQAIKIAQALA